MEERIRYFYVFFIGISLLFWNPVTFYLMHSNDYLYSFGTLKGLFTVIFCVGVLLAFLIAKGKFTEWMCNGILVLSNIGILFGLLALTNQALRPLPSLGAVKSRPNVSGLVFNKNDALHHSTVEFDYITTTNSLGLRGVEVEINKGDKFRIICVGDSWTYGWGANNNETWPAVLQQELHQKGLKQVEVINCAYPGGNSDDYKQTLQSVVPILQPDLVLVGMHQLDDLAQIYERQVKSVENSALKKTTIKEKLVSAAVLYIKKSLEHFTNKLFVGKGRAVENGPNESKKTVNAILTNMNESEKREYEQIDTLYKRLFIEGNINPSMVYHYLRFPRRQIIFNNPLAKETKNAVKGLSKDLLEIKQLCKQNESKVVCINLPEAFSTGHQVIVPWKNVSFYTAKENKIDSIYNAIALKNDIPYMELTQAFINLSNKDNYFFKYDGHPNKNGYKEMGIYIADELLKKGELCCK